MKKEKLILNLKKEYFEDIKNGKKLYEYRIVKEFWRKRLSHDYETIEIRMGYPKSTDKDKIILFYWDGYNEEIITHKEFGNEPVSVFAISLLKPLEVNFNEKK